MRAEPIVFPEVPADFPFPLAAADLNRDLAYHAYCGTSFSPERRADQEQRGYLEHILAVWRELLPLADTDERRAILADEMLRYRNGYLHHANLLLTAKSRCLSVMIAGPSKFPVRRAEKANAAEHRRSVEFSEWDKKAQTAMRKKLLPPPPAPEDELTRLVKQRDLMKAINAEYRKCKGNIDAMTVPSEKVKAAMLKTRASYYLGADRYVPFESFDLTSVNGKIKRLQGNIDREAVAAVTESREVVVRDVTVVDNAQADRLQLFYPGKPLRATIDLLKSNGFRWTPSVGCWQAYRTDNGWRSAERVLGVENLRAMFRAGG